jgi:hypothetical protein
VILTGRSDGTRSKLGVSGDDVLATCGFVEKHLRLMVRQEIGSGGKRLARRRCMSDGDLEVQLEINCMEIYAL